MTIVGFIPISIELDKAGLVWHPEIGDEVLERGNHQRVSILVDPQGLSPRELRGNFLWLPTVEQLVQQFEARQALIYHAGVDKTLKYEAVIRTNFGVIESKASTLREAFGLALSDLLKSNTSEAVH